MQVRIRAFHDKAPVAAKLVTDLAKKRVAPSLNFYRHEHVAKVSSHSYAARQFAQH